MEARSWTPGPRPSENLLFKTLLFCGVEKSCLLNALLKISWSANFKTRKMIANGIVMSRIIYLIEVYGNASEYLLRFLQVLQNKAARIVTRLRWGTETALLLNQVGWLSVKQLYVYHSLVLVYKMQHGGKPTYLNGKFRNNFAYQTRQATGSCFILSETPKSEKSRKSFVYNTTQLWNSLSTELRKTEQLHTFKINLKEWIKLNVPV